MAKTPKKKSAKKISNKRPPAPAKKPTQPETGTGLNVESKPKSVASQIEEKQQAKLAEKVKAYRDQEHAKSQSSQQFAGMKASKPKKAPSFSEGMKAAKEKKAANKLMIEGATGAAKDFPGPKNEEKNIANKQMLSGLSEASKSFSGPKPKPKIAKKPLPTINQKHGLGATAPIGRGKTYGSVKEAAPTAVSSAEREAHSQYNKPGLNPMDYKGASMSKHFRHAFSDKGPIGKAVNKITGKYDRGFEKVAAPVERGIKSAAKGTIKGVKAAGRGVKAVGKALVSPTAQGIGQAALTHAGMAIMHGSNYPQKMHELSQQGPRTFRPGWHGFTAPEKTHDTDATDTRGERS